MIKKILAIIISCVCIMSVLGSASVSATEIQPRETEESGTTEKETTEKGNDYNNLKPVTTKATTEEATTKKPTTEEERDEPTKRPTTTKRPGKPNNNTTTTQRRTTTTERDEEESSSEVTVAATLEETLPNGQFYVYVEKNNGEPRLKRVMDRKSIVPQPSDPIRPGYLFQGWYADPEFKKQWNFYTDEADIGTVIYAKWAADEGNKEYKITIDTIKGGKIEVNPSAASEGEYVIINVLPDEGKRLVVGSVMVDGAPTDVLSFLMPAKNVVISAQFEDIPEEETEDEEKSIAPLIVAVVIVAVVLVAFIVVVVSRRRDEIDEDDIDENGTIIDDDDDDDWYDETITVEDGFKEGEKVVGNFVPDDDADIDYEDIE